MKGFLKGLRYFTHMFEEEKEPEIQIGAPTDVKHVAHIGWDGPSSSVETPSWMKEFKASDGIEAAPGNSRKPEEGSRETSSSKQKQARRNQSKESSSDGPKSSTDPDQRNPTEKRSRRKKSKESINVSRSTRSKNNANNSRDRQTNSDLGLPGQPILTPSNSNSRPKY